jgi:hypothetical protein
MSADWNIVVCALGLAVAASANPYESIASRNSFSLVPPKADVSTPGDVWKPAPEYKLTGIAGFGATKWALLSKADPGKPPAHFMLREGQRDGPLEIVQVDEIANLVRIRNDGTLIELTFGPTEKVKIDLATKRFVDEHTRAHQLHQQREAERIARERALFEKPAGTETIETLAPELNSLPRLSAPEQAILESQL